MGKGKKDNLEKKKKKGTGDQGALQPISRTKKTCNTGKPKKKANSEVVGRKRVKGKKSTAGRRKEKQKG